MANDAVFSTLVFLNMSTNRYFSSIYALTPAYPVQHKRCAIPSTPRRWATNLLWTILTKIPWSCPTSVYFKLWVCVLLRFTYVILGWTNKNNFYYVSDVELLFLHRTKRICQLNSVLFFNFWHFSRSVLRRRIRKMWNNYLFIGLLCDNTW